jgi:hypothetical protein
MRQRLAVRGIELPGTAPLGIAGLWVVAPKSRSRFVIVGNVSSGISHIDSGRECIEYFAQMAVASREPLGDSAERVLGLLIAYPERAAQRVFHRDLPVGSLPIGGA